MSEQSELVRKADGLPDVQLKDFKVTHLIGKGSFGSVYFATLPASENQYAIKTIRKDLLADSNSAIKSALIEFQVCFEGNHPNLCSMDYFYQTGERLYFIMPLLSGGDLRQALKSQVNSKFASEDQVKFMLAQVIMGIGKLHQSNIMHRDIKLENLVLDKNGYVKVIDFGLARVLRPGQMAMTQCGTPAYSAPEVIQSRTGSGDYAPQYDKSADWWSVGIAAYELIVGVTPFCDRNPMRLQEKITRGSLSFPNQVRVPHSDNFRDLVTKLLVKEPTYRLGNNEDASEILSHPWFADIDLDAVLSQTLTPDFIPASFDHQLSRYKTIGSREQIEVELTESQKRKIAKKQDLFAQFSTI